MPQPAFHQRHTIRLKGYDYAQAGAYFITICTHQRTCLFGDVCDAKMHLNEIGKIVHDEWLKSPIIRAEIELGEFIIMPNHFHAIVWIIDAKTTAPTRSIAPRTGEPPITPHTGTGDRPVAPTQPTAPTLPPKSLGSLIAGFKSAATLRINQFRNTPHAPVWQRNYYEHIIRDEKAHQNIANYIINNPLNWQADQCHTH